jgi:hypothetical protein
MWITPVNSRADQASFAQITVKRRADKTPIIHAPGADEGFCRPRPGTRVETVLSTKPKLKLRLSLVNVTSLFSGLICPLSHHMKTFRGLCLFVSIVFEGKQQENCLQIVGQHQSALNSQTPQMGLFAFKGSGDKNRVPVFNTDGVKKINGTRLLQARLKH